MKTGAGIAIVIFIQVCASWLILWAVVNKGA